jgi:hypothetical protein
VASFPNAAFLLDFAKRILLGCTAEIGTISGVGCPLHAHPRAARVGDDLAGGVVRDVIAPPPGELFPETNDNSVAILLAGDAEAKEEEYMAGGPYTGPLTVIKVPKLHTL